MTTKEEKFSALLRENDDRIRRICRYYSRDEEQRKDMYQEILTNIWKNIDKFRGDS